ncbi:hypothetical protein F5B18DRAFT_303257 [Nemania serpens]|nr:hypothetical protein F5B18DRAFT_303257 [Nemania serpens]
MRGISFLQVALLGLAPSLSMQSALPSRGPNADKYATRKLGGIEVIDTDIVREAAVLARKHSSDFTWNHLLRGWLYGVLVLNHNHTLRATVDIEAHAVACLLHDLGWDQTPHSPFISPDRRFEVDGAIAARNFINSYRHGKNDYDEARIQLVWDSIALHTEASYFNYKEPTVAVTGIGINMDFSPPNHGVTQKEQNAVIAAFPRDNFLAGVNQTFVWLAETKPATTYDTFMQAWGDAFVPGFSAVGHRAFDLIAV